MVAGIVQSVLIIGGAGMSDQLRRTHCGAQARLVYGSAADRCKVQSLGGAMVIASPTSRALAAINGLVIPVFLISENRRCPFVFGGGYFAYRERVGGVFPRPGALIAARLVPFAESDQRDDAFAAALSATDDQPKAEHLSMRGAYQ